MRCAITGRCRSGDQSGRICESARRPPGVAPSSAFRRRLRQTGGRAILTISASSATLIRHTFFSRHPARLRSQIAVRGSSALAAGVFGP